MESAAVNAHRLIETDALIREEVRSVGALYTVGVSFYHFSYVAVAEQRIFSIQHAGFVIPISVFGTIEKFPTSDFICIS